MARKRSLQPQSPASDSTAVSPLFETLFLYIDILGFRALIDDEYKTRALFKILDGARLHRDSNFASIVFSDTIVAYNRNRGLGPEAKRVELMYLIELTQDLLYRLAGTGIPFRAVITEGNFTHYQLEHFQAYYGRALVDAYRAEKEIKTIGLFLDRKLRPLNQTFKAAEYSETHDFIYLIHMLRGFLVNEPCSPAHYPLSADAMREYEEYIYPEIMHCREIYTSFRQQRDPNIRVKYETTWRFYEMAYPGFMTALRKGNFDPRAIGKVDWEPIRQRFIDDHPYSGHDS